MALAVPAVKPLADLYTMLNAFKTLKVPVGPDERVRTEVRVCGTKTGRNTASTAEYPFNLAPWLRQLLRPTPGTALVSCDYAAEEFQIAAALSQDPVMLQAYRSGDPYVAFARHVGAIPPTGDKISHPEIRAKYKRTVLAASYGMTANGLAPWLQVSEAEADALLAQHRAAFQVFWQWSIETALQAKLVRRIETRWGGWPLLTRPYTSLRTLQTARHAAIDKMRRRPPGQAAREARGRARGEGEGGGRGAARLGQGLASRVRGRRRTAISNTS